MMSSNSILCLGTGLKADLPYNGFILLYCLDNVKVGDGQGGLACCSLWGHKEWDPTEQLN